MKKNQTLQQFIQGKSQEQVAAIFGMNQSTISKMLSGRHTMLIDKENGRYRLWRLQLVGEQK